MPIVTRSAKTSKMQEDFAEFRKHKRRGGRRSPAIVSEEESESETDFNTSPASSTESEAYYSPEPEPRQSRSRSRIVLKEKLPKTRNVEPEPQKRSLSRTKSPSAVHFEKDRPPVRASRERSRSATKKREVEEDYGKESSSRNRSRSRNHPSKFLVLEITKIRGMKNFPITHPYSANMKLRITATFRGIAKASPQIAREGAFDPNNLTFVWKISTAEVKIIEDLMDFHVKLTIERDESQGKRKWTHIVGEANIPGKTDVTIGGGPFRVELQPTVGDDGRQQLEYYIDLQDNERY